MQTITAHDKHLTPRQAAILITIPRTVRFLACNRSVYKDGRKVHIEYLHSVTLWDVTAKLSIRLAVPA
ncbi:hypothetical protein DBY68_008735 [Pseudocitrobacter sp. RIT415]|nr:hypothetical protein DBY68_008735 [Pseudocitrobacter sp. RIT 415]